MKLSAKYNRINIFITILVLLVSSFFYYFIIQTVFVAQFDTNLNVEKQQITNYVRLHNSFPDPENFGDENVQFTRSKDTLISPAYSNVTVFNKALNENEYLRQVAFSIFLKGENYLATIQKSQEGTKEIVQLLFLITLGMVVFLLSVLFVINRFLLNKLWHPFNSTLQELKKFDSSNSKNLHLESTSITEFAELNNSVRSMTDRVRQDYNNLKAFTENASHEMQTPLAIINSKLDLLIQDESINPTQMLGLKQIYDAVDSFSRLNRSLLLLAKIENNQFLEKETIQLDALVNHKITQFQELIAISKLTIKTDLQNVNIEGNKYLWDILISNLLNNAICYNCVSGTISVTLTKEQFIISNTSTYPALDQQKVFQRFYRPVANAEKRKGNGLGLSIIKQICDSDCYELIYNYSNDQHEFSILF